MSYNVAILKALQAEGLDLAACIRVLEAGEKRNDPTAAERMARMRAKKAKRVTRNVTHEPPIDNTHTPEVSEDKSSSPPNGFTLPDDIPAEPWADFEEMRKRIRKPMTNGARKLAVKELRRLRDDDGWPPGDVLNHCTMNSYQGIYPPKDRRNDRQQQSNPRTSNPTLDILRAANAEIARSESGQDNCGTRLALPPTGTG